MVTKGKSKANQCEAEAEQELSREVAGGRCSSHVSSTWATGMVLNQRRCQPTSEWCVVFCALSPGSLWKVCIQISLGGTTEHPLGKRASFWGTWVHSFFRFGTVSLIILGSCTWNPGPALLLWWVLVWLQQHGGNEQGRRNQIWLLIAWLHLWRKRGRKEEYFFEHSSSLEIKCFLEV